MAAFQSDGKGSVTLDQLVPGKTARVVGLTNGGAERRRMVDLGILPGAKVEVAMRNPLGDPTAYRIRDAVVALRREQARCVQVEVAAKEEADERAK